MWDMLRVTHEETNDVKMLRNHALIQEYELFRMKPRESIIEVQRRFTHITNHLIYLKKDFDKKRVEHQSLI